MSFFTFSARELQTERTQILNLDPAMKLRETGLPPGDPGNFELYQET